MSIIYFYWPIGANCVGSVNEAKIRALAKATKRTVYSCDIGEFKGRLLGSEWNSPYVPDTNQLNFDVSKYDSIPHQNR